MYEDYDFQGSYTHNYCDYKEFCMFKVYFVNISLIHYKIFKKNYDVTTFSMHFPFFCLYLQTKNDLHIGLVNYAFKNCIFTDRICG